FARGLKELEKKIADVPNCVAICSSGEDQRSWISPERGMSIFGHYFLRGIHGGMRGPESRPRISLKDLQQYLESHVYDWSHANRSASQNPFLIPAGQDKLTEDIEVTTTSGRAPQEPEPQKRDELVNVRDQWQGYYELARSAAPESVAPQAWKRYTELL